MSIPHRDDAPPPITQCPGDHDKAALEIACRDVSWLTIVAPVIETGEVIAGENLSCIGEIQPALGQGPAPLYLVPGHPF
jgi:hypothetical protein